jgi:methanogenic corrinoid protein MtbC1
VTEKSVGTEKSTKADAMGTAPRRLRLYLDSPRAADVAGAYRIASAALEDGMSVPELYQRVVAPAMHEVGRLWERGAHPSLDLLIGGQAASPRIDEGTLVSDLEALPGLTRQQP